MGHSAVEHRLKADIADRHRLKNEIRRKRSLVTRLNHKLKSGKKKRLVNRYSTTIKRLSAESEALEVELHSMNLNLQERIAEEMEFSEGEIQAFREQYQKELAEMQDTEDRLETIEAGEMEPGVEETSEDDTVPPKEAIVARTRRMLDREKKIVRGIEKEISSEERDKEFFTRELRQIMAELEIGTDESYSST